MSKTDQTIDQLLKEGSTAAASHPLVLFLQWLAVTCVSTGVIVAFMAPRPDLAQQLASPLFCSEIASLFLVIVTAAISAVWMCYPDLRQKPAITLLPLIPAGVFVALSLYRALHPEVSQIPPPEKVHGIDCAGCVTSFAIVPGFWMFYLLRRNATTYPKSAGAISFLASASIGLLALKLAEANDSVLHLLQWHVAPMLLLALGGAWLGKKYLIW